MNLAAAEPYRFIVDPCQQLTSKPLATFGLNRRQVVHIDVSSPTQVGALPEPGDGHGIDILAVKDPDQPVTLRSLNQVNLIDEVLRTAQGRAQLPHGCVGQIGIGRRDLSQHQLIIHRTSTTMRLRHPTDGRCHGCRSLVETTLEGVLRYRSSFTQLIRVTMVETELGGQIIPADTVVIPWLLSANRDEREFPHPDRFDIHRFPHHLAFGHGIHFCIGQLLARVEARVAVGVLLD